MIVGGEGGDHLTGGIGRQLRAAMLPLFLEQRLTFFVSSESLDSIEGLAEHLSAATGPRGGADSREYSGRRRQPRVLGEAPERPRPTGSGA